MTTPPFSGPELTVVVPTLNEEDNIAALVERLRHVLQGIDWEVIFVDDDSVDSTRSAASQLARADGRVVGRLQGIDWEVIFVDDDSVDSTRSAASQLARADGRVRLLHRIGRRGLASACIEGVQTSTAPYVAIMDADLQHDESLLPRMLEALKSDDVDIVVGSRYVAGGDVADWDWAATWRTGTRVEPEYRGWRRASDA